MVSKALGFVWIVALAVQEHSQSLTDLFQLLFRSAIFRPTLPLLAGIALIGPLLLSSAQILCTFPGRYLYKFPGEIEI